MQLRPASDRRFALTYSETFEAGFYRLLASNPFLHDAQDYVEWALQRTPHIVGEPSPAFEGRDLRLMLTPGTPRYPALRVLYEIAERTVKCWHVCERL